MTITSEKRGREIKAWVIFLGLDYCQGLKSHVLGGILGYDNIIKNTELSMHGNVENVS